MYQVLSGNIIITQIQCTAGVVYYIYIYIYIICITFGSIKLQKDVNHVWIIRSHGGVSEEKYIIYLDPENDELDSVITLLAL